MDKGDLILVDLPDFPTDLVVKLIRARVLTLFFGSVNAADLITGSLEVSGSQMEQMDEHCKSSASRNLTNYEGGGGATALRMV